jgi:hypothetical protein
MAYLARVRLADCEAELEHEWATGGVLVTRPDAWWKAGGMDERFLGWGFEDAAYRTAADALLGPTVRHEGTIAHLWHPPESNLGSPEHVANGHLCQRYVDAAGHPDVIRGLIAERDQPHNCGGLLTPGVSLAGNSTGQAEHVCRH